MKISFLGADLGVTGSKHLIEVNGYKLLLDCGMHQGPRKEAEELNSSLPFVASEIDAVILSHGHLDHCGMLPVLIRDGFQGKIYCTPATAEIAALILADSAKIQEQDAFDYGGNPLYTNIDVQMARNHFETIPYFHDSQQWTELNSHIRFKFYDAGHILGSAITYLEIKDPESSRVETFTFTGDLGHGNVPIIRSPESDQENCQTVLMEATYGNKIHKPFEEAAQELARIVNAAAAAKSKVIIPAFALGRTQEIVYLLHLLEDQRKIPTVPIFVDSPLSMGLAQVYEKHRENYNKAAYKDFFNNGERPLEFKNLRYTESAQESRAIGQISGTAIIIASSGMMEGGRILHHLREHIIHEEDYILITGYQSEGTLGRRIQDGQKEVNIIGKNLPVRAKVVTLNEFSAHADQTGLLDYLRSTSGVKKVFLVHTELPQATAFKEVALKAFPELEIVIPEMNQSFEI